ncbi:hypothetical protein BW731_04800 [Vagococcus martis]|uniref:Esterase n=1 Tax=Vagococcus martis TaxID=1768210 RepID=A0A1V4DGD9_9ENTE|nr:alpha/beta hydrolase-fold protein [Vagococcus martis]OPF87568.1 hypothetical protein BW731_04800 [Vagococcus martis]
MSIVVGDSYSTVLAKNVTYCGFFPNELGKEVSVIYLLHGRGGNAKSFLNQTTIERFIQGTSFIAFSVDVGNSYYANSDAFGDVLTFVSQEFPIMMQRIHPFNIKNEFIIGISMGGYGVLKLLEKYPDRYRGSAMLSPLLVMDTLANHIPQTKKELGTVFQKEAWPNLVQSDLHHLGLETHLIHCCGKDDFMIEDSLDFSNKIGSFLPNYSFYVSEGEHNWDYWDGQLSQIINEFNQLIERRNN